MSSTTQSIPMDSKQIKRNRLKLLGIFAVALLPLFLALAMYFGGWAIPDNRTNKGNLLWPPVELNLLDLQNIAALPQENAQSDKWSLMVTGGAQCAEQCMQLLHEVRQVNIAMGREAERIRRLLVSQLPVASLNTLAEQYPELVILPADAAKLSAFQHQTAQVGAAQARTEQWQVWVVDPLGNVILQYTEKHDGYDIMDDLKRLLKLSKIG
ncbi:MAG: hypothetical protein R3183_08585 [Oleiphilaceae bacterium]|nr:hypothetical protein [Oleiphilaceae bacterium]